MTDEGVRIPDITEMTTKGASVESIISLIENSMDRRTQLKAANVAVHGTMDDVAEALGRYVLGIAIT